MKDGPVIKTAREDEDSPLNIVQSLVGAIAIMSFCYVILCSVFIFAWSRQIDIELLFYVSLEDFLISGIVPTAFWVLLIGPIAMAFWAPTAVWPMKHSVELTYYTIQIKRYILLFRNGFLWASIVMAFVQFYFNLLKNSTGYRDADYVVSWLPWVVLAFMFLFVIAHILATWRLTVVVIVPALLFIAGIIGNFYYGTEVGGKIQTKRAQFQVDLIGDEEPLYATLVLPPLRQGIVFFKSEICNAPHGDEAHFVPWSAIKELQAISEDRRVCD